MTNKAPLMWGYFYHQTELDPNISEFVNNARRLVEGTSVLPLRDVLRTFQPDAIVCTHFLPVELLLRLKHRGELHQPVYCVVTDYSAHTFWANPGLEGYFVGSDHTRDQLIERGVASSTIYVSGIPINPDITKAKDSAAVRAERGLVHEGPVVTLFGGGVETGRIRDMVTRLLQSGVEGTLVVVAGRNETLVDALKDLRPSEKLDLRVLGLINYVDDLIVASDLVVTKSGGLIVSEVLARSTPMIVIEPIPGQEEWNADYVVSSGAGVQLRMPYMVPDMVAHLLARPERLADMRDSASLIARPGAAITVADQILNDLMQKRFG
jgi:processive 1,2-diacylglycerol beta-glucosyltransferase